MAEAEVVVKQRRTLKGKQVGIIINDVLTVLEEEAEKPLWTEYKNAKGMGKRAYFVRAKLFVDGKLLIS